MCNILLVDVGGTNIDLNLYNKKKHKVYHLKNIPSRNLQGDNCYLLIKSLFNFEDFSQTIIGIPGDVKKNSKKTFCPPLGYEINIEQRENVIFVNDMYIQPFLISNKIDLATYKTLIIICSGTSIGTCIVDTNFYKNYDLKFIESFEFAHAKIDKYNINKIIPSIIEKQIDFHIDTFCTIYSVGGMAALQGLKVDCSNNKMLRIKKYNLSKAIKNNNLDFNLLSSWKNSLENDLISYLDSKVSLKKPFKIVYRGGLINAFEGSYYSKLFAI